MYFYFCADYPAVIKLDGIYYGSITDTIKLLSVDSNCYPFVEVCSLSPKQPTINFILDNNFIHNPPENVSITDMKGGYLIKLTSTFCGGEFSVINQTKTHDYITTVFNDNGYKLSIETPNDFFAESLPYKINTANFYNGTGEYAKLLAVAINDNPIILNVYSLENKIKKIFCRSVCSFELNDKLTTTETFFDMAKHVRETCWDYKNKNLQERTVSVTKSPNFCTDKLPQKLIPYAFLEELFIGGDYKVYLSENVSKNADMLSEYFGAFIGIMPPPIFRFYEEVGVIYKKEEQQYYVEYFTFEFADGKISNIKKSD